MPVFGRTDSSKGKCGNGMLRGISYGSHNEGTNKRSETGSKRDGSSAMRNLLKNEKAGK